MALIFFILSSGVAMSAQAVETGFSAGNQFEAIMLRGRVMVDCTDHGTGQRTSAFFDCSRYTLFPAEQSAFRTEPGIEADRVALTAHHGDGSQTTKESKFDSAKGKSKSAFNLWIRSLTQRPMLQDAKTDIDYALKKNGQLVKSGTFTATVTRKPDLYCPYGHVFSDRVESCQFAEYACEQYFYEYRFCH